MRRAATVLLQRRSVAAAHTQTALAGGSIVRRSPCAAAVRCDPSTQPTAAAAAAAARRFLRTAVVTRADVPPSPSAMQQSDPTDPTSPASVDSSLSPAVPLPFAIVGSGPAAFYTAKYLLRELPHARVDMFERLAVPGGLVRFGVAPDHPDVKSVSHDFEQVSNDSRFAFWGNVSVGTEGQDGAGTRSRATGPQQAHISVADLRAHYAGVIFAYGASSERALQIPGAHLKGIHPSRHFVQWYNSHPDLHPSAAAVAAGAGSPPVDFDLSGVEHATIVGQGNVAVDCARILLSPLHRLEHTDISSAALDRLRVSRVARVSMLGRRGAIQSAFSIGELRELATGVEGLRVVLDQQEMARSESEASKKELEARPMRRKHDLMLQVLHGTLTPNIKQPAPPAAASATALTDAPSSIPSARELHIRYLLSPREFLPSAADPTRVGAIVLERTELRGTPGAQEAVPTGELLTMPTQLVLTSIGYRSLPLQGLPFDARRSIVPSVGSRVVSDRDGREVLRGCYVSGWVKRGPSGIIASNILDARETVKAIVEDVRAGVVGPPRIQTGLPLLASPESIARNQLVTREAWGRIDAIEQSRGMQQGKPRVKMTSKEEMLRAAAAPATVEADSASLKSN